MSKFVSIFFLCLFPSFSLFAQNNCFSNCWNYREQLEILSNQQDQGYEINLKVLQDLKGCSLPEFSGQTLAGKALSNKDLKDKIVVLNFWFIYCAPCVAEMPALNKLVNDYKDKEVVFLAFGLESQQEIKAFLQENPFNYQHIFDTRWATDTFCAMGGFPMNMVFDRQGKLRYVSTGGNPDEMDEKYEELKPVIEEMMKD